MPRPARVREEMGLENVQVMVPFVRTVARGARGRTAGEPTACGGRARTEAHHDVRDPQSNALLAAQFLEHFDGFSIGSNDLTQLTLGLDRDSGLVADMFDERDAAVKMLLKMAIDACNAMGRYVGICGQGPSDHPDLAQWLVEQGIESMSLNPDVPSSRPGSISRSTCRRREGTPDHSLAIFIVSSPTATCTGSAQQTVDVVDMQRFLVSQIPCITPFSFNSFVPKVPNGFVLQPSCLAHCAPLR
jgi:hypothetical protein